MPTESVGRAAVFRELSEQDCTTRLSGTTVGRIALCTPDGPVIIPVNYVMDQEAVVVRTAPYSLLARHASGRVAFEIDHLDHDMRRGWSVLVVGQASPIEDADQIENSQHLSDLTPWAPGSRNLFIRIQPLQVTGREVAA